VTTKGEWITNEEQLARWVAGESVHRQFKLQLVDKDGITVVSERDADECTPDFSCCRPNLLAEPDIRVAFRDAPQDVRHKFLGLFLRAMLADMSETNVAVIAGEQPT